MGSPATCVSYMFVHLCFLCTTLQLSDHAQWSNELELEGQSGIKHTKLQPFPLERCSVDSVFGTFPIACVASCIVHLVQCRAFKTVRLIDTVVDHVQLLINQSIQILGYKVVVQKAVYQRSY